MDTEKAVSHITPSQSTGLWVHDTGRSEGIWLGIRKDCGPCKEMVEKGSGEKRKGIGGASLFTERRFLLAP